jgi:uncharacterized lipoprotein YmbA
MLRLVPPSLVLLAGCSILSSPPKPQFHYLTLTPRSGAQSAAPKQTVALEPIELPGYLEGVEIVERKTDDEIQHASADRWAEPLSAGLPRTLAQDLDSALAPSEVAVRPHPDASAHVAVFLAVDRFEQVGGQVELVARWTIRSLAGPAHRGTFRDHAALAAAHTGATVAAQLSGLLTKLSDALAADVLAALHDHKPE